jgi:hypothetical protein
MRALARIVIASLWLGEVILLMGLVIRPGFAQTALKGLPTVSNPRLDSIRGGLDFDSTRKFSIGIERAVFINGQLVTTATLTVSDLTFDLSSSSLPLAALTGTGLNHPIQNGPGNTFTLSQGQNLPPLMTVIQNTLNNQNLGVSTTINARVPTLDVARNLAISSSMRNALGRSLR